MKQLISIKGAKVHNLQNVDLEIPRHQLVVFTGVSGSGKSSLVFDTIYAEGQRRYIESLSSYARQFLGQLDKPDVDHIEGLSPAICVDQKKSSHNPRSTVGTVTEIYDYLRVLFSSIGKPHCPSCGQLINPMSVQEMQERVLNCAYGQMILIFSPLVKNKKGSFKDVFIRLKKEGFSRVRVDGKLYRLSEVPILSKTVKHTIDLFVDKFMIEKSNESRLFLSLEMALKQGEGFVEIVYGEKYAFFSEHHSCLACDWALPEISPRLFSFNSPTGACESCNGLGDILDFDVDLVIEFPDQPLKYCTSKILNLDHTYYGRAVNRIGKQYGFDLNCVYSQLSEVQKNVFLYGSEESQLENPFQKGGQDIFDVETVYWEGVMTNLRRRYFQTRSEHMRHYFRSFMSPLPCSMCHGARLKQAALSILIQSLSIHDVVQLSIVDAISFFDRLSLSKQENDIAGQVLLEIVSRLGFLKEVGLSYLTLSRQSSTLSGGEFQRIRLATQIGSGLTGVLYVLDEPSIGLHQRDNQRLIAILQRLRDLGNSVLVVEHDEETIKAADYVVEIGPQAGKKGGKVVFSGKKADFLMQSLGLTVQYLVGEKQIALPKKRRDIDQQKRLVLKGASENNLKNVDISIPLSCFVCVSGVSGSGKSTLIYDTLYRILIRHFNQSKLRPGRYSSIDGLSYLDKVIVIDQSPIGRTPRSNPATYSGIFTPIREIFSQLPEARVRGYKPGRFSFNVRGGRCEGCEGDGVKKIEMHFLADVFIPCDVCKGKRYNAETLSILFKGKSISDVLGMTVNEAMVFFDRFPAVIEKLKTLHDVGLGYIQLGQNATTLSGGEAQRVKLAKELSKKSTGKSLYLLDEPTTGLHLEDIKKLLTVLNCLVDQGNTVLVIEHHLDVLKVADYLIDLGPDGGDQGGEVVAVGTPEDVVLEEKSCTGYYLKKMHVGCQ